MKVRNRTGFSVILMSHCGDHVQIQPHATTKIDDKFNWHIDPTKISVLEAPPEPVCAVVESVVESDPDQPELPLTTGYVEEKNNI